MSLIATAIAQFVHDQKIYIYITILARFQKREVAAMHFRVLYKLSVLSLSLFLSLNYVNDLAENSRAAS